MLKYRTDIDGLRAIAVGGVVIFHAFPSLLTGGFIGVDVFFVLSGFLITKNICADVEAGKFSIASFYERRFRRILPALFAMVILTSVMAIFILPPTELKGYGKSLTGVGLFVSNIIFWRDSGYFETFSADKPLLHTWSLAVEEQFYIAWPIIASILVRLGRPKALTAFVWGTILLSLLAAILAVQYTPSAAFYLLPFRAWELGLGALLATGGIKAFKNQGSREIAAWGGLALIVIPMCLYNENTPFPGLYALPPCLGTLLLVHAGQEAQTQVGRFISWRPILFVGLVSYSFYLWHWPLLVLPRVALNRSLETSEAASMVVLALALSAISLRYVERPFRGHGTIPLTRPKVLWWSFGGCALLALSGIGLFASGGLKAFARPDVIAAEEAVNSINPWREACHNDSGTDILGSLKRCTGGTNLQDGYQVLLWGDSHADHLASGLDRLGRAEGFTFRQATVSGCSPIYIFEKRGKNSSCASFHRKALDEAARQPNLQAVIISARWSSILAYQDKAYGSQYTSDEYLRSSLKNLVSLVRQKIGAHPSIILVGSTPEFSFWPATCLARAAKIGIGKDRCINAISSDSKRGPRADNILKNIDNAVAILPRKIFCNGDYCKTSVEDTILYRDDDHLTNEGSWLVISHFGEKLN